MTLPEICAIISSRSPYPLMGAVEDHDAIIAIIADRPDHDRHLAVSIAISRLELTEARFPELLIASRTDRAVQEISQSLQSSAVSHETLPTGEAARDVG